MKKVAVFVEGQTEQIFVERLLVEVIGQRNLIIAKRVSRGGKVTTRRMTLIEAAAVQPDAQYYVMIVDCGTDSAVKSDIRERYEGLTRAGYEAILGIRDVYPVPRTDIARLAMGMRTRMPTQPVSVDFILAVMEVEAWFLGEHTHFQRVHPDLAPTRILNDTGLDVLTLDPESRPQPAADLHTIYSLVGFAYRKRRNQVDRTVGSLDYASLYLDLPSRVPSLAELIASLNAIFN